MHSILLPFILFVIGSSPQLQENPHSTTVEAHLLLVGERGAEGQQLVTEIIDAFVETTGGHEAWAQVNTYSSKSKSISYTLPHKLDHWLQVPEISNSDYLTKEPTMMLVKIRKPEELETIIGWSQQSNWSVVGDQLVWEYTGVNWQIIDNINEGHSRPYSLKKTLVNAPETLSYGGQTELNGVQVHIINEASHHGDGYFSHFFNTETYLLEAVSGLNGSVMHYQKNYQWFDCQDGFKRLVPTRSEIYKGDRLVSIKTTSDVQYNPRLDDSIFLAETYTDKPFNQRSPDLSPKHEESELPGTVETSNTAGNR